MSATSSPHLVNFGPGVSPPKGQKAKNFGNAYLVDSLRDRAEVLWDGGPRRIVGRLPFW